jgi:hypothetical protein
VLSGRLVDVPEIEADAVAEWRKLRGLLLAVPTRVANQAVGMKRSGLAVIEQEVRATLEEMAHADYTSPIPFESEVGAGAPTAEATAPKRVDRRNIRLLSAASALPGRVIAEGPVGSI